MRRIPSQPPILPALAIGLTILALGCSHAEPKPDEAPVTEAPAVKAPAAEAPDTSTLSGRLQLLGQEIEAIPETTSRRMGPELERIRKTRDELDARLKADSKVVGEKIKSAVETLEDDLRQMRSRLAGPPPESTADDPTEPEATDAD